MCVTMNTRGWILKIINNSFFTCFSLENRKKIRRRTLYVLLFNAGFSKTGSRPVNDRQCWSLFFEVRFRGRVGVT